MAANSLAWRNFHPESREDLLDLMDGYLDGARSLFDHFLHAVVTGEVEGRVRLQLYDNGVTSSLITNDPERVRFYEKMDIARLGDLAIMPTYEGLPHYRVERLSDEFGIECKLFTPHAAYVDDPMELTNPRMEDALWTRFDSSTVGKDSPKFTLGQAPMQGLRESYIFGYDAPLAQIIEPNGTTPIILRGPRDEGLLKDHGIYAVIHQQVLDTLRPMMRV